MSTSWKNHSFIILLLPRNKLSANFADIWGKILDTGRRWQREKTGWKSFWRKFVDISHLFGFLGDLIANFFSYFWLLSIFLIFPDFILILSLFTSKSATPQMTYFKTNYEGLECEPYSPTRIYIYIYIYTYFVFASSTALILYPYRNEMLKIKL